MNLYHLYFYPVPAEENSHHLYGSDEECRIGIFSSREKALRVAETLKTKSGFRKWPDGFRILVSVLDDDDYAFKDGLIEFENGMDEGDSPTKS